MTLQRRVRLIVAIVVLMVGGLVSAETLLLSNGAVMEGVVVLQRYPDGTVEVEHQGIQHTFTQERYKVLTDKDLVVFKDGSHKVGRVLDDSPIGITFEEEGGKQREIPKSLIKELVRAEGGPRTVAVGTADGAGVNFGDPATLLLDHARRSLDMGNYKDVANDLAQAIEADAAHAEVQLMMAKLLLALQEHHAQQIQSNREEAQVTLEMTILQILRQPEFREALPALEYEAAVQSLNSLVADSSLAYGHRILKEEARSLYETAGNAFRVAEDHATNQATRLEAILGQAKIATRLDQLSEAKSQLRRAAQYVPKNETATGDASARRQMFFDVENTFLSRSTALGQQEQPIIPRPVVATPTPTEAPRAAPPPIMTPVPTPEPTPPPSTAGQYFNDYVKAPYDKLDLWSRQYVGYPAWQVGIAAFVVILILYFVPQWMVRRMVDKGNYQAVRWQGRVKWLGALGLLGMYIQIAWDNLRLPGIPFLGRGKKKKEREPGLDHNIDALPVYEVEDYVQRLVRKLDAAAMDARATGGGSGISMGLVEKDLMQKLVRGVITMGIKRRASDVHIEPELDGANIRMRLDGVLYDMVNVPRSISTALVSSIKVMADLDISQKRIAQDGKISMWVDNTDVDIRINSAPGPQGERITMRLLDSRSIQVDANRLGLEGRNLDIFENLIRRPSGVVYITGPTGSGKTTTLYVALNSLNTGEKNILTIEDPIEYQLKGISQMQVNEAAGFTFAQGLRSILRSDPDIIMVGEIRDKETAEIAIDAASTGHLVFTTAHTIDAPTVLTRLLDLGVESRRAANSMLAAVAQRLIRINCPNCKEPYKSAPAELKQLGISESEIEKTTFLKGVGCDECQQTGFQGRLGLYEIFMPDEQLREMMEANTSVNIVRENARRKGMRTLREEGIMRVVQGVTTVEEVLRAT